MTRYAVQRRAVNMSDFIPSEPIDQSDRPDSPIIDGPPAEVDPVPTVCPERRAQPVFTLG